MSEKKTPSWVGILFLVGIFISLYGIGLVLGSGKLSWDAVTALIIGISLLGISLISAWTYQKRRKLAKTERL